MQKNNQKSSQMALSQYLSRAGVCSRRQATILVNRGDIEINGKKAANPGIRIAEGDVVTHKGKTVLPEQLEYIMLNKPRHVLTTMSDPSGRATVMAFLPKNVRTRVYPVGRLDKETSGLLLFTNDGDCALKLSHPRYGVQKVYQVHLDRPCMPKDMDRLKRGVKLEDGMVRVDSVGYASQNDRRSMRIVIHNGKKRVVRRVFEALNYKIKTLDRPKYAGLNKRGLRNGEWRYLTKAEITHIKKISV